jgi:LmbE family N-acetylglucosaminyl deacetylase
MNILAIGAHQDEVETQAGGTIAKYAKAGHKVFIATATNGNKGSATMSPDKTAAVRKAEAKKAAAIIGAEYICLDFDDEMFFDDRAARLKFLNLARYCKADVILTHYPVDYTPDCELTSKIIKDIALMIPVAKIKTESPPYDKTPAIFYFEPHLSINFVPTEFVDISDVFETKMAMCREHKSQIQWKMDVFTETFGQSDEDYFDTFFYIARYRGLQCGVKYAEAFSSDNSPDRIRPYRILPGPTQFYFK